MEIQGGKILRVQPLQLHYHWPKVREGVERIKELCPLEPWIVEDVYAYLRVGWAHLHIGESGFLVTQDLVEDYTGRAILHVWLAYSSGGEHALGEEYLRTLAGGRPIRFHSPRVGWAKFAKVIRTEFEL